MINHETESALRQKADKHEIHDLQRANQSLKNDIRELTEKVERVSSNESTLREIVVNLIDFLSHDMDDGKFHELQSLRHQL